MSEMRRVGEMHLIAARTKALRVFAFTGSVFPGEWSDTYNETIALDLFEFAYHARRINEICSIDISDLQSAARTMISISGGYPGSWVGRYDWALNRILHAKSFIFGNVHADHRKVFTASRANLIPTYVIIATDQRETETISLYGLVDCFLRGVIPKVKERFPEWAF